MKESKADGSVKHRTFFDVKKCNTPHFVSTLSEMPNPNHGHPAAGLSLKVLSSRTRPVNNLFSLNISML
jgi:hypothetical protein